MYKTYQPKEKEIKRNWHLIDAKDQILGRLSTNIATLLMGKQKANYSTHMDSGDNVVIINCEKVKLTGRKKEQKVYRGHSGYPGGFKEVSFEKMFKEHPNRVIEFAVSGMLPDNRLKSDRMARLHVTKGEKHKYEKNFK
ncbi:50S ribosomal protein L13 [Candidatus Woesebacteria bacterium RIFOXYC1_FULL_31_51]|uniref:Large ribosomal subunit protein uL13 n=1 Tax=Candidatus Woesebacteria bacterium GW2011_GWC2_31_9 TaxID=1618586 RepID=A0A0F9YKV6_9BACT|nr:MAG: 50S ribosomal protein L13, large subunit ribosomal protein L13 [Candidatus Woesebacteria bacterium GW2011_GWF1_31_35]KKP23341.1 MAG: 50S ribosomal protein L13 [Candidatus Woesebacteria bacterium GW2011_GWC1_30_29]KKP26141.1 MAG: 50S ribosomal protein L13 [Candidatus Woesebacteria bacterium GW2011_GWD1_31_12]KKP27602.1 MAG: 50S ribosomal protein L13 [Candidatus Woesebacteria bacterium GW2011_GWB1_31_29]KKP30840.1 MAG: 50S ribosomal protein L13 [Candidatus Woesebacteria bacterium GW2011_G